MKIIYKDLRKGEIKVKTDNLDDLWYLSQIIEKDDIISGKTERKVKVGEKQVSVRKKVFVSINVENIEFSEYSNILRVSGKTMNESEDIQKGDYHTFNIGIDTIITIHKDNWTRFYIDKINEATKKIDKVLIVVFDRGEVTFALTKRNGFEIISEMQGDVEKKREGSKKVDIKLFYKKIINNINEYIKRYDIKNVIIASPAFWKDEIYKLLDDDIKKKVVLATCHNTGKNGVIEVLKRPEARVALKKQRVSFELSLVDELFKEISKKGNFAYGIDDVENAAMSGAVKILIITDNLINKFRRKKDNKIDDIIKNVESMNGEVHIISSSNEGGQRLDALGGIGAILRYKINFD